MKKLIQLCALLLCLCLLGGCAGTPVIYHGGCDCPTADNGTTPSVPAGNPAPAGEWKTGLALSANAKDSFDAAATANGEAKYDVTMVAVLVDNDGIIRACTIDGIATSVKFDTTGAVTSDKAAAIKTKNELGSAYGMVNYGGAIAEWDVQAKALADFAVGKTVAELREGAIDESGKAPEGSDLASSATIYLGGYVSVIEQAVANAKPLGAKINDTLRMAATADISGSKNASDKDGLAQLEVTVTALTMKDGKISSCALDSVQAKVSFNASGAITSDKNASMPTKNELGSAYGMVNYGGAIAEWDAQAAAFAAYVKGKTPAEVAGIAVDEKTAPTEADLATSVTIAIGGFQALIQKAAQ